MLHDYNQNYKNRSKEHILAVFENPSWLEKYLVRTPD